MLAVEFIEEPAWVAERRLTVWSLSPENSIVCTAIGTGDVPVGSDWTGSIRRTRAVIARFA